MKLWDKGISIDTFIEKFTVGNDRDIDLKIATYDIQASLAHAQMLVKIGLLNSEELNAIKVVFDSLQSQISEGTFVIDAQFEDIHSKLEYELTKALGDTGKKIHTRASVNFSTRPAWFKAINCLFSRVAVLKSCPKVWGSLMCPAATALSLCSFAQGKLSTIVNLASNSPETMTVKLKINKPSRAPHNSTK